MDIKKTIPFGTPKLDYYSKENIEFINNELVIQNKKKSNGTYSNNSKVEIYGYKNNDYK